LEKRIVKKKDRKIQELLNGKSIFEIILIGIKIPFFIMINVFKDIRFNSISTTKSDEEKSSPKVTCDNAENKNMNNNNDSIAPSSIGSDVVASVISQHENNVNESQTISPEIPINVKSEITFQKEKEGESRNNDVGYKSKIISSDEKN